MVNHKLGGENQFKTPIITKLIYFWVSTQTEETFLQLLPLTILCIVQMYFLVVHSEIPD